MTAADMSSRASSIIVSNTGRRRAATLGVSKATMGRNGSAPVVPVGDRLVSAESPPTASSGGEAHPPAGGVAATADVFVHGQRPGFVEQVGLDREALTALNPRLIYAFVSGFGTTGPWAHRRAIDMLIQAESGLAAAQSGLLGNLSFVDTAARLALSNGILAALLERATTGRVQHVEVRLLDT